MTKLLVASANELEEKCATTWGIEQKCTDVGRSTVDYCAGELFIMSKTRCARDGEAMMRKGGLR